MNSILLQATADGRGSGRKSVALAKVLTIAAVLAVSFGVRAEGEFVAVEWTDAGAARGFAQKCGINLSLQPVAKGSARKAYLLTVHELNTCPGLIRKLPDTVRMKQATSAVLQKLTVTSIPLIRAGAVMKRENVSPAKLAEEFERVEYFEFPWGYLKPDGHRRGYVYLANSHRVIANTLNPAAIAMEKEQIQRGRVSVMSLHEVLQAAGYYDRYYEFSLALWVLSRAEAWTTVEAARLRLARIADLFVKEKPWQVAGGCSIVCGGGDGNELYFKLMLIEFALQRSEFAARPEIRANIVWKIVASEIREITPLECQLLMRNAGGVRCSIYGEPSGRGTLFFVGDYLLDPQSTARVTEALTLVMKDIAAAAEIDELKRKNGL